MRFGLSVYGTVYAMGIAPASGRPTITPRQLMDQAVAAGLTGVEFPPSLLQVADPATVRRYAQERGLFITVATGGYDPAKLKEAIDVALQLGATTVRTVAGGAVYGGDRRPLAGRWQGFLAEVLDGLAAATRIAEQAGVTLALENHQDLASEDLLWLCERIGSQHFGITLDAGNPLATAEEPIDYFERLAPYLKNVHLKDYWIYLSEEGYRLVRCPIGQGAIDFPALMRILQRHCPDITCSVEIGALEARHTRVLAPDFWPDYPPRPAPQLARLLRFVHDNAKPAGDWRTPFEKQEGVDAIVAYETRQLASSIAYVRTLGAEFS